MTARNFAVDDIVLAPECQSRAAIHPDVIDEYTAALLAGAEFPPCSVVLVAGKPYVVDGFHRATAYRKAGGAFIPCVVVGEGTLRDAVLASIGVNHDHGLRRTNADKRRAVETLLADAEWAKWSDREIARAAAVGVDMVGDRRRALRDVSETDTSAEKRKDSKGRLQPASKPTAKPTAPKAQTKAESAPVSAPATAPVLAVVPEPEELPSPPKTAEADEYADHIRLLRSRMAKAFANSHLSHNGAHDMLKQAEGLLRMGAAVDCPTCESKGGKCRDCGGRGWVTRGDLRALKRGAA